MRSASAALSAASRALATIRSFCARIKWATDEVRTFPYSHYAVDGLQVRF